MIRAVLFATFDYFHKNLEWQRARCILRKSGHLDFWHPQATAQRASLNTAIKSKGPDTRLDPLSMEQQRS